MTSPVRSRLADNVCRLRRERGWSQAHVAELMGVFLGHSVDATAITRLEGAIRSTTVEELSALAAVFDVPYVELLPPREPYTQLAVAREEYDRTKVFLGDLKSKLERAQVAHDEAAERLRGLGFGR